MRDRPSVAVIDDHELVREGLVALIDHAVEHVGPVVYSGSDVQQALLAAPDIALLDVDLGADAPPVTDNVRVLSAGGARVLLISAFEEAQAIRAAIEEGALGFVPKRVSVDALRDALQTVAQGEFYLSVDLATILAAAPETPNLSPREIDALRLYASGLKLSAVANRMGISPHTAKEYLDRVRAKYAGVGRSVHTRTDMYVEARRDGLLDLAETPVPPVGDRRK